MNGLYFTLRSRDKHCNLRHSPCQIKIVERPGQRSYLVYIEDISKNRPKGRKIKPKVVIHHENLENQDRCFVRLFKKYQSLCPPNAPVDSFYLTPLQKPKEECWFKHIPIGRNKLSKAILNMCKECGIKDYKTNHSLRATSASCLYPSGMDEQLVEWTGHRNTERVLSYKRTSMQHKQEISDILNMDTRIKTNTTNQTGDITNSAVANVSFRVAAY